MHDSNTFKFNIIIFMNRKKIYQLVNTCTVIFIILNVKNTTSRVLFSVIIFNLNLLSGRKK